MGEMAPVLEELRMASDRRLHAPPSVGSVPSTTSGGCPPPTACCPRSTASARHPDARRWHDAFAESIADEALELVRPTSYSRPP